MMPFPQQPTPDHIPGQQTAGGSARGDSGGITPPPGLPASQGSAAVRVAGRIDPQLIGTGARTALAAILVVLVASFLPWYSVHVAAKLISACPPSLHGTDLQACRDESRGAGVPQIAGFYWTAWDTPLAWIAVLAVLALAALLVYRAMPAYRPAPDLAALLAAVVACDVLFLIAFARLPSPGRDNNGAPVPGSQAFIQGWGLWIALAGMLLLNTGIGIDLVTRNRRAPAPAAA